MRMKRFMGSNYTLILSKWLLLLLLLPWGTSAQQIMYLTDKPQDYYESANLPALSGKITSPIDNIITLQCLNDFITFEERIYKSTVRRDGGFHFNVKLEEPTAALLIYNGEKVEVFLEPEKSLYVTFNGKNFAPTLSFSGEGSQQNTYLKENLWKFSEYNQDFLAYEMTQRSAMDFRHFMDGLYIQKLKFWENYDANKKEHFSSAFKYFALADIHYWWAYHLMRYRKDYPATHGLSVPMTLPEVYYDFLTTIQISNEEALNNKYYIYFLDTFFDFVQENPPELAIMEGYRADLVIKETTTGLMSGPLNFPVPITLKKGQKLQKIEGDSPLPIFDDLIAWCKVIREDGTGVWVNSADLAPYIYEAPEMDYTAYRNVKKYSSHVKSYGVTIFDELQVRKDPYAEEFFTILYEGDEVDFLYNRTKETITYQKDTTRYRDYFIKIKTQSGREGWVFRGGLDMKEKVVETSEIKKMPISITPVVYNNAQKYLKGKARYYVLAKDIYYRANTANLKQLKKEITDFLELCEFEKYEKVVQNAYNEAIKGNQGQPRLVALHQLEPGINRASLPVLGENPENGLSHELEFYPESHKIKRSALANYVEIDCKPAERARTITKIKGNIQAANVQVLKLVLITDPILQAEDVYMLTPDEEGNFDLDLKLAEAKTGILAYGGKTVDVYLEPGDDLSFNFHAQSFLGTLNYEGKGSVHNNFLKEFTKTFATISAERSKNTRYAKPEAFKAFMDTKRKTKWAFYKNYEGKKQFSAGFDTYAQANINYWHAFYLLNYAWEHPLYHEQEAPMQLSTSYYDFLNEIEINTEQALKNRHYAYFIQQYVDYQLEKADNSGMTAKEAAEKFLKGEPYYFYQAKLLARACRRGKIKEAGKLIQEFLKESPYATYNDVLRYVYNESKDLIKGMTAPDFSLADINGKEVSLSDFKGKVIYIDFWATWCGPCLRSLQHNQKLIQKYQDEDIVFLYVGLDEDKSSWENYVNNNKLGGRQLLATGGSGFQSQLAKLYKVKELPTYFLIDKDGKIAEKQAGSPTSTLVVEQINRLLIQN